MKCISALQTQVDGLEQCVYAAIAAFVPAVADDSSAFAAAVA